MGKDSFDVDDILKEVRKRREENEARIKAEASTDEKPALNDNDIEKINEEKEKAQRVQALKEQIAEKAKASQLEHKEKAKAAHEETQKEKAVSETKEENPPMTRAARQRAHQKMMMAQEAQKEEAKENKEEKVQSETGFNQDEFIERTPTVHYENAQEQVNLMSYAEEKPEKKKKKKKASKKSKIIKAIIFILVIAIIAAGCGIYLFINRELDNVTQPPEQTNTTDEWTGMSVLKENFEPIYETPDSQISSYKNMCKKWYYNGTPASSTHVLNVLLIGEDTRDEEIAEEGTRADSAIIVSVNKDTSKITLTSILRDTYCYYEVTEGDEDSGQYGKINEAMSYGGVDCYIRCVENNFKVNIDNYAIVNFESFQQIVDTLGGVTVEMTSKEIKEINNHQERYNYVTIDAEPGLVELNGEQALAYCRIRKIDSDNERANRQKTVLLEIFNKMKTTSTVKTLEVATNLLPYVKTGFSKSEIVSIGKYALQNGWLNFGTATQTIPENTTDENGAVITTCKGGTFYGVWCWKADLPLTAQLLQQSVYGKTNIVLAEDRPNFSKLS